MSTKPVRVTPPNVLLFVHLVNLSRTMRLAFQFALPIVSLCASSPEDVLLKIFTSAKSEDVDIIMDNCAVLVKESSKEQVGTWAVKLMENGSLHKGNVSRYIAKKFPASLKEYTGMTQKHKEKVRKEVKQTGEQVWTDCEYLLK
jgi:hypothetical protein